MKKIYILSFLSLILAFSAGAKQKKYYMGEMKVTPVALEQMGDSLYVRIDFDMRDVKVQSRRSISLIPLLTAPDRESRLPEVMVKGRADYLTSKRELALMSKAERKKYEQSAPYAIVKGYKSSGDKRVAYRKTIYFESWMREARLDIREDLCGCGITPRPMSVSPLLARVQMVEPYAVKSYLTYVEPEAEAVKRREMSGEAFLDFVVAKTDIRPDYMNNPQELKKITDMIDELRGDSTITVKGISVAGYASPEGTLRFNRYLSQERAKALVGYLTPRFDFPAAMYGVTFGGENWEGLLAMVEASDMKYRDEVIDVLKNVPADIDYQTNTGRKKSLMDLKGGEPYRYMLKTYFPALRKAVCRIDYEVREFTLAEAVEIYKIRPESLSLLEMYRVARTYEEGSKEFTEVFETAARLFPNDETANLNAAAAELSAGNTDAAEHYLRKVTSPSAEYDNTMGVLLLLKGDYAGAEACLEKAAAEGLPEASRNKEELRKKQENIKQLSEK